LIGEVKNLGYETADFVKVSVTIYNTDGGVIGTDSTYARPSTLSAGQKSTFDIFGRADDFKGMDHYELSLEWKNPDRSQGYVENAQIYKANTTESEVNGASIAQVKIPKGSSVEAGGNFEPATLKIGKGSTVKWINDDDALHTVTSGTPNGNKSGTIFDSGYLSSDNTYKHTFEKTGTFKYYDTLHTYMRGKIVVSSQSTPLIETAEKEPTVTVDTTPNTNINVSNWSNFTDSENRFSIQYPSHWIITQSGNRFTKELPLVAVDANGSASKIQSQLSVNLFKSNQKFDSNHLAKYAYNQLVKQSTGSKLVEAISCNKYRVGIGKACSFLYAGDDKEGKRYGILEVAFVDDNKLNHLISYRADPLNFDKEMSTMEHIIQSYNINQ
jgi:plastocyanin